MMDEMGSGPGRFPVAAFSCPDFGWKGGCSPIMDAILPSVDERDAEAALRQAILSLRLALADFEGLIERIGQLDERVTDTQATKAIVRLRETFQSLTRERLKFETDVNGRTGAFGTAPLDLAAARTEVGRLLDCLRADRRAGGISVEPEP